MPLVYIIIAIVCVGFLLYAFERWVPMDPFVKRFLSVVVVLFLIIWLMRITGLWEAALSIRI